MQRKNGFGFRQHRKTHQDRKQNSSTLEQKINHHDIKDDTQALPFKIIMFDTEFIQSSSLTETDFSSPHGRWAVLVCLRKHRGLGFPVES